MSINITLPQQDEIHGCLPPIISRTICWSQKACDAAFAMAQKCTLGATDVETIPYKKPGGKKGAWLGAAKPENTRIYALTVVAYAFLGPDGIHSFAFPMQRGKSITSGLPAEFEYIVETIRKINALPQLRFTMHNGAYDSMWFIYYDMPVANYAYDSMTMFWSRWPDMPRRLDFVSSILLDSYKYWKGDRKSEDYQEYMLYGMGDCENTLLNTIVLMRYCLIDSDMCRNFFRAHFRCLTGIHMSARGMAVDEDVVDELTEQLLIDAQAKLDRFRYLAAMPDFNINSAPQKKVLVYKILGAAYRNTKGKIIKKEEDASTGRLALQSIRNDHPLFRRVINALLDAGKPAKQISNVIKMPRFLAGSTGSRMLTSYDGVGTTTERYSSRASAFGHGSNAQNVQKKYRRFARADRGCFLMEVDLSAADDVFVALESGERKKIDLIRSGLDTHAVNALIFFDDWTYDGIVAGKKAHDPKVVDPITGIRQITKKVVHGCHYLMAGGTLLASAGREAIVAAALANGYESAISWNQDQLIRFCELLDAKFRRHYPRFQREQAGPQSWYYELRREVVSTGGFRTAFNYFQRFTSDPRDDSTLRAVAATAGQAGTAGRINLILDEQVHGYIPLRFRDAGNPHYDRKPNRIGESINGISIRLQTHDSITYNIDPRHPKWEDGVRGIFETFSRPVVVKGEEFCLNWEADVGIYWAQDDGVQVKTLEDVEYYVEKISAAGLLN